MRNRPVLALFFAAVCMVLAHAQTATPAPEVTGSFRFVPEGEYILRIADPGDVVEEVQDTQQAGLVRSDYRHAHSYASVDQPISVHTDVTNLNISVPDKPASEKAPSTAQKQ
jgi:hypothetical protein